MAGPLRAAGALVGAVLSVAAAGVRAASLDGVEAASSVLAFFESAVRSGGLAGSDADEPDRCVAAVREALVDAWDHVAHGDPAQGCEALEVAGRAAEADPTTPDVLAGSAVPALRTRLVALMAELGCFDDPSAP